MRKKFLQLATEVFDETSGDVESVRRLSMLIPVLKTYVIQQRTAVLREKGKGGASKGLLADRHANSGPASSTQHTDAPASSVQVPRLLVSDVSRLI